MLYLSYACWKVHVTFHFYDKKCLHSKYKAHLVTMYASISVLLGLVY